MLHANRGLAPRVGASRRCGPSAGRRVLFVCGAAACRTSAEPRRIRFMMAGETIILASASPRRRELLAELGVPFAVVEPRLAEPVHRPEGVSPTAWAEALAHYKTREISESAPHRVVLGADTIVVVGSQVFGKPADEADARRMLEMQARHPSDVITGVCVERGGAAPRRLLAHAMTRVWMNDDRALREEYLASGDWRGKAGAYGIQDVGDRLVRRLEGDFSNVVGLPLRLVRRMLLEFGVHIPPPPSGSR
ncbi:MAG: septum formation protein Maf [Planctomycetota bacterium]|nr:MAG: septum formation protein Maf [Planctomycetota bacterium]